MIRKPPYPVRPDAYVMGQSRINTAPCVTCQMDTLHVSGVCIHCKHGGIPTGHSRWERFNRSRR